jgi:crossover junction endodeoxyribonuclease RuvC
MRLPPFVAREANKTSETVRDDFSSPHAGHRRSRAVTIAAIDPGAHGALAFLTDAGALLTVVDLPSIEVRVGKGKRTRVVPQALALLLAAQRPAHAFVERVGPMPRDGAAQAFGLGMAAGLAEGVLAALGVPVTFITPQAWKRAHGLTADKGAARRRAMQLFPSHAGDFQRVKDDGRAEATLIGLCGLRDAAPRPVAA